MIKKVNYIFLIAVSLLGANKIFAEKSEEFESTSKNVKFVPICEDNQVEVAKILTNPDCFSHPYDARKEGDVLTAFINKHIEENKKTNLGGWLVKINNIAVGVACFSVGNIPYTLENGNMIADAKKNPLNYIEAGGQNQNDYTQLQARRISLNKSYQAFYPELISTFISHAFEENTSLKGIRFITEAPHNFSLAYAKEKKLPCTSHYTYNDSQIYIYDINRAFYTANKEMFK